MTALLDPVRGTIDPFTWRMLSRVLIDDGCWAWIGAGRTQFQGGYGGLGVIDPDGTQRTIYAHVYLYEMFVGKIPEGYHVDHLCSNVRCCNPDHLEAVTPAENIRRGHFRKRLVTTCKRGHDLEKSRILVSKKWRCGICWVGRKSLAKV